MGPNHKKLEYFNDKTRVFARNSNFDPLKFHIHPFRHTIFWAHIWILEIISPRNEKGEYNQEYLDHYDLVFGMSGIPIKRHLEEIEKKFGKQLSDLYPEI